MKNFLKKFSSKNNDDLEEIYEDDDIEIESESDDNWLDDGEEGQLSIDVYQTAKEIVIKSTIAGVKPSDIDIAINNDMLTIRGKREMNNVIKDSDYLFRECYWGAFSRSIILPVEIQAEKIDASLENGVLTVTLPKAKPAKEISIKVKG
jgi:HSP20 family protein